ncbi:MAG: hypothetical protein ACOY99_09690 [Pseudomonadota bacterium]
MKYFVELAAKSAPPLIYDKAAYLGACDLVKKFGPSAALEALHKADQHESRGERQQTHYWRRVESAINILLMDRLGGPIN